VNGPHREEVERVRRVQDLIGDALVAVLDLFESGARKQTDDLQDLHRILTVALGWVESLKLHLPEATRSVE